MWIDFGNAFQSKRKQLGNIIAPVFKEFNLLLDNGNIPLSKNSSIEPGGFLENFRDVIFKMGINSRDEFYEMLHTFASKKIPGLLPLLEKWWDENPQLYAGLCWCVPDLVQTLESKYSYEQIDQHRKVLKKSIEILTLALEEKLK